MPAELWHSLFTDDLECRSVDFTIKDPITQIIKELDPADNPDKEEGLKGCNVPQLNVGEEDLRPTHPKKGITIYRRSYGQYNSRLLINQDTGEMFMTFGGRGQPIPYMYDPAQVFNNLIVVGPGAVTDNFKFVSLYPEEKTQYIHILPYPRRLPKKWFLDFDDVEQESFPHIEKIAHKGNKEITKQHIEEIEGFKNKGYIDHSFIKAEVTVYDKDNRVIATKEYEGGDTVILDNSIGNGDINSFTIKNISKVKGLKLVFFVIEVIRPSEGVHNKPPILDENSGVVMGFPSGKYGENCEEENQNRVILRRKHQRDRVINSQGLNREVVRSILRSFEPEKVMEAAFTLAILKALGMKDIASIKGSAVDLVEGNIPEDVYSRFKEGIEFDSVSSFIFKGEFPKHILDRLNRDYEVLVHGVVGGEKFVGILDENGRETGFVMPKKQIHQDGEWHSDVYVFVFNTKGKVLLQTRAESKEMYPLRKEASASGHILIGQTPRQAAIFRLKTELGLDVQEADLIALANNNWVRIRRNFPGIRFRENTFTYAFAYILPEPATISLNTDEISGVEFVSIEKLLKNIRFSNGKFAGIKEVLGDKEIASNVSLIEKVSKSTIL